MSELKLSRTELYELIWAEPIRTLSKKHEISPSQIKKSCLEMTIPIPDGALV